MVNICAAGEGQVFDTTVACREDGGGGLMRGRETTNGTVEICRHRTVAGAKLREEHGRWKNVSPCVASRLNAGWMR